MYVSFHPNKVSGIGWVRTVLINFTLMAFFSFPFETAPDWGWVEKPFCSTLLP